mgnify:CR=1 FL=1
MEKHQQWLKEQLENPEFAAEFLTAAAEDSEPSVYLSAIRKVARSRGMGKVAEAAGIPKESLSRALSARGNPRWSTLSAVLRASGMKLTVTAI